jgi:hypothetical protein
MSCVLHWRRFVQVAGKIQCGAIERQIAAYRPAHVKGEFALKHRKRAHTAPGEVFVQVTRDYGGDGVSTNDCLARDIGVA